MRVYDTQVSARATRTCMTYKYYSTGVHGTDYDVFKQAAHRPPLYIVVPFNAPSITYLPPTSGSQTSSKLEKVFAYRIDLQSPFILQ